MASKIHSSLRSLIRDFTQELEDEQAIKSQDYEQYCQWKWNNPDLDKIGQFRRSSKAEFDQDCKQYHLYWKALIDAWQDS